MTQIYDPPPERAARRTGSFIVIAGSTGKPVRRDRRVLYARRGVQVFGQAGAEEAYGVFDDVFQYGLPGL